MEQEQMNIGAITAKANSKKSNVKNPTARRGRLSPSKLSSEPWLYFKNPFRRKESMIKGKWCIVCEE